jgi:hypothetical protein
VLLYIYIYIYIYTHHQSVRSSRIAGPYIHFPTRLNGVVLLVKHRNSITFCGLFIDDISSLDYVVSNLKLLVNN